MADWSPIVGRGAWSTAGRWAPGSGDDDASVRERLEKAAAAREAVREKERQRRCKAAAGAARKAGERARVALDRAYAAARALDVMDDDSDEAIELDVALQYTVRAQRRAEVAARGAIAAAGRVRPLEAERGQQEAERYASEAGEQSKRVARLARELQAKAER